MKRFIVAISVLGASFGPFAAAFADAPATVGALLDGGGKKMTKNEILKLFAGATINGTAMGSPGSKFRLTYMPDGSAKGEGWAPGGSSTTISGTWSANDQDQYCQDLRTAAGVSIRGCFYYFAVNDQLYAAPADARSAPVYERRLTPTPVANPQSAPAERDRAAAALAAWLIGDRLSLAAIVYAQGGAEDFTNGQIAGAKQVADSVGVTIPPLPSRGENKVENLARTIRYLIKGDGAQLGLALGRKYDQRDAVLFELAVKSNIALIMYSPDDPSAFPEVIRSRSESIGLPPELWSGVVTAMLNKKSQDDAKHAIIKMHEDVAQYLKGAIKD